MANPSTLEEKICSIVTKHEEEKASASSSSSKQKAPTQLKSTKTPDVNLKKVKTMDDSHNKSGLDQMEALLIALGDDEVLKGENIHPSLAQKLNPILLKGLGKNDKDELFKAYKIPENCKLLKAPSLNEEVTTVVDYRSKNRDEQMEKKHDQLGLGITAVARAITVLLERGENYEVNAMRHLNHGCRILADVHYMDTEKRRTLFTPELSRTIVFQNILSDVQDLERDETLFGKKLTKVIKKQGIPVKTAVSPVVPRPKKK